MCLPPRLTHRAEPTHKAAASGHLLGTGQGAPSAHLEPLGTGAVTLVQATTQGDTHVP